MQQFLCRGVAFSPDTLNQTTNSQDFFLDSEQVHYVKNAAVASASMFLMVSYEETSKQIQLDHCVQCAQCFLQGHV
jgi:hypothetical protein